MLYVGELEPGMPTVATMANGAKVCQYYKDHHPPHFHVVRGEDDAQIRIADFGIENGTISPADHTAVTTWGRIHQAELALNWVLAGAGLPIVSIPVP